MMMSAALLQELARTGRLLAEAKDRCSDALLVEFSRDLGIEPSKVELLIQLFQTVMSADETLDPVLDFSPKPRLTSAII